jgi:hypothetical protein
MKQQQNKNETDAIDIIKQIANLAGYNLIPKEHRIDGEIKVPSNVSQLKNMSEEELKQRILIITEDINSRNKKINSTKQKIVDYLNKEGPNDMTKAMFIGNSIPESRVNIIDETQRELALELDYIEAMLNKMRKQRILKSFSGDNVVDFVVEQGSMGMVMKVFIK